MVAVEITLLIFGLIIFLGFFASLFFEKTKIPDVLILIAFGVLLGPVFEIVNPTDFLPLASTVGTLALIVILFDSGLNLNLSKVLTEIPNASFFSVIVFALGAVFVGGIAYYFFNWNFLHALLLGIVGGGTGSNVVLTIVRKLSVNDDTRILLGLESLINDVLSLVGALIIIQILNTNSFSATQAASSIASAFAVALVAGILAGLFWLGILKKFNGKALGYVITLGFMFILYPSIDFLGGSGAIAVLAFSLILGNAQQIAEFLRWEGEFKLDSLLVYAQNEVSFFVRTFYFVYFGLLFSLTLFSSPALAFSLAAVAGFLAARVLGVRIIQAVDSSFKNYSLVLVSMMPRGLVAAVLAFLPLEKGIIIPYFAETVFLILFFTNVLATVGTFAFEIGRPGEITKPQVVRVKEPKSRK
ncbi:cation:proton antiporter [Candidatus Micrarchaeota archaeon]|nr:cation:proton antiporter [Candidatus Micrarchaeota archaeon]